MKVMVMVKATRDSEAGVMPSKQLLTDMGKFNAQLVQAGILLAGEGLHPSSKGVRVRFSGSQRTVMDGPFTETNELVAGFWLWKVASMDEAIAWVKRCPNPMLEDSEIEIRRVFEPDDFGPALTPELREQEQQLRSQAVAAAPQPDRFEQGAEMLIAGLNAHYTIESRGNIGEQWARFVPYTGHVPGQVGNFCYGVCWNYQASKGFDYLTGVAVREPADVPHEFTQLQLPACRYAVFTHRDHVSALPATIDAIWTEWLPSSGLTAAAAPCFERYTDQFNPQTGRGGMEVWIPLETHRAAAANREPQPFSSKANS